MFSIRGTVLHKEGDLMSAVKQVPVSGVVAFGPRSLLAVGTAAGSIDHDFSNESQLEVSTVLA